MSLEYYNSLNARVDAVTTCPQLQELEADILAAYAGALASVNETISALDPLLAAPSANFGSIISWINKVIDTFAGPYARAIALQAEIAAKQVEAITALADKATEINC